MVGEKYRFTILTEGPSRYESSSDGHFEDRQVNLTPNDHPADGLHVFEDEYKEVVVVPGHDTNAGNSFHSAQMIPEYMTANLGLLHRGLQKDSCGF